MTYIKALTALADPTRRKLYEKLRHTDRSVGELVTALGVSQPAVSQHLGVLRGARLVTSRSEGARRYYRASSEGLADLRAYIESLWDDVLEAFAADDPNPPPQTKRRRRKPRA